MRIPNLTEGLWPGAALALALTLSSAWAEEPQKIDPARNGPTEAVTDGVSTMKGPVKSNENRLAPTSTVGDQVPVMKPTDKATGDPAAPKATTPTEPAPSEYPAK